MVQGRPNIGFHEVCRRKTGNVREMKSKLKFEVDATAFD